MSYILDLSIIIWQLLTFNVPTYLEETIAFLEQCFQLIHVDFFFVFVLGNSLNLLLIWWTACLNA